MRYNQYVKKYLKDRYFIRYLIILIYIAKLLAGIQYVLEKLEATFINNLNWMIYGLLHKLKILINTASYIGQIAAAA